METFGKYCGSLGMMIEKMCSLFCFGVDLLLPSASDPHSRASNSNTIKLNDDLILVVFCVTKRRLKIGLYFL
jgi:hypothetical protein